MDFNPTLVRLGLALPGERGRYSGVISIPLWFDWGEIFGRYDSIEQVISIPLWFDWGPRLVADSRSPGRHFNPTLVRLGPERSVGAATPDLRISIPLWFDWGAGRHAVAPRSPRFQSHFGSIGAVMPPRREPAGCHISIPLWFDWGSHLAEAVQLVRRHFNPTLVRLGHALALAGVRPPGGFQSHFGSIGAGAH